MGGGGLFVSENRETPRYPVLNAADVLRSWAAPLESGQMPEVIAALAVLNEHAAMEELLKEARNEFVAKRSDWKAHDLRDRIDSLLNREVE
jgi:hypothetical protein